MEALRNKNILDIKSVTIFSTPSRDDSFGFDKYRICSRNLRTFFSILAAEKSGCVKYADFFVCGDLNLGFILVF